MQKKSHYNREYGRLARFTLIERIYFSRIRSIMGLVSRLGRKCSSDNSKSNSNVERSRTSGLPLSQSPKDLRNYKYHHNRNQQFIGGIRDGFLLGVILCVMMFISFGFPMNSRIYSTLYYNGNSVHLDSMKFKPIAVVSLDNHMHLENGVRTGNFYIEYDNLKNSFEIQLDDEEDDWDPQKTDKKNANCESLGDWQQKHYPTCNSVHEHTLQIRYNNTLEKIGSGGYREVWAVDDGEQNTVVLKTLTWDQDYDTYSFNRNLQRHNRDALAMERLHSSSYVVDLFAFCANGGLYEYGHEGSLSTYLRQRNRDSRNDLMYMLQASLGLAAFHSIDDEQKPSIVHNDIKPDQYILIDGVYKLNDFNKASRTYSMLLRIPFSHLFCIGLMLLAKFFRQSSFSTTKTRS